jgi:hypothetical protein
MNRKKKTPPGRGVLSVPLIVLTTVAVAVAVVVAALRLDLAGMVYSRTRGGGSQSTLTAIRDIPRLETLAYVRRTVFPHDYLLPDLQLTDLVRMVALGGGDPEEALSPREHLHYRAANLASRFGLATRRDQGGYVVVTVVYRFGYEVGPLTDHLEQADPEDLFAALPPGTLLSIDIEDLRRETYPYGPVSLDAEGWKEVTAFVAEADLPGQVKEDLASQSRDQAVMILRRLIPEERTRP